MLVYLINSFLQEMCFVLSNIIFFKFMFICIIFREKECLNENIVEEEDDPSPSCISPNESPGKCNLSLSFNFDFNDVNSVESSDSETADLQIDVSEIGNYGLHSKHKRDTVEETSSVINEMEEEIERQLDAKAAKTNLTATNVKNILKHVITNEHVMAMVKNRLQDTEDDILFEPKLTRAKAKYGETKFIFYMSYNCVKYLL